MRKRKQKLEPPQNLFDSKGEFILTSDSATLLDTILTILTAKYELRIEQLNLELRRCGFFLTIPELKQVLIKIQKDGYISGLNQPSLMALIKSN